jgi:hypothetical protein
MVIRTWSNALLKQHQQKPCRRVNFNSAIRLAEFLLKRGSLFACKYYLNTFRIYEAMDVTLVGGLDTADLKEAKTLGPDSLQLLPLWNRHWRRSSQNNKAVTIIGEANSE